MSIASRPFCLRIQIIRFLREATGPIYGSGLKEKTALASITNYHFSINAKKKKRRRNTKIKTIMKRKKISRSHIFKEYFPQPTV